MQRQLMEHPFREEAKPKLNAAELFEQQIQKSYEEKQQKQKVAQQKKEIMKNATKNFKVHLHAQHLLKSDKQYL